MGRMMLKIATEPAVIPIEGDTVMDKNIKYKLVDEHGYTRKGQKGETYWLDGQDKIALGHREELYTPDAIHYYDHPLLAILFNPIHAGIANPRLIVIQIDKCLARDGLKGGCKKARYIKEIDLPLIGMEQRVEFAIRISLKYYKNYAYNKWAKNWLNGKNRTAAAARDAAAAAWSADAARSAEKCSRLFIRTIEKAMTKRRMYD